MKEAMRLMAMVSSVVLLTSGSRTLAQNWPQWRGANRDGKVTGFTAFKAWPKEFTRKWKVTVGLGDASPALVGDRLYVFARQGDDEVNLCLDAGTGKELWQDKYAAIKVQGADAGQHSGPRSSPTVAEGKVVTLGVGGVLTCLDAGSGKMLWRKEDFPGTWPRFHTAMSPIVVDGLCIAQLGKEGDGAVVAYELATGNQKWKWTAEGPGYASPVLLTIAGTKMICTLTEKSVVGIAASDGKLLWQIPFAAQGMNYNAATPIVDGQTVIYCGAGRGTRAVKIEKQGDSFATKELWSNPDNAVQFNTPVLKDAVLFGLSSRNDFFCINAQDGKTAWTAPSGGRRGFGSIVDAGSVLLALTPAGQLIVFEPSDKEYKQLASIKVADSETYAHPIVAGKNLFVKDQDSLTLWAIE